MEHSQPMFDARINLVGRVIHYIIEDQICSFRIDDILMLGEFSAPPGTLLADYFFVFKIKTMEHLLEVPAYADGLFPMLAELRQYLPQLASPKLQLSTEFDSRVIFPAGLVEEKLFSFQTEIKPWVNLPVLRGIKVQKVVKEVNPAVLALN